MKELSKIQMYIYNLGGIMLVVGALMPMEASLKEHAPYIYLCGALTFGCMQLLQRYEGTNIVIKRLRRQQIVACMAIILSGFMMLIAAKGLLPLGENAWMAALAIGAFILLYVSFRLPAEFRKENEAQGE